MFGIRTTHFLCISYLVSVALSSFPLPSFVRTQCSFSCWCCRLDKCPEKKRRQDNEESLFACDTGRWYTASDGDGDNSKDSSGGDDGDEDDSTTDVGDHDDENDDDGDSSGGSSNSNNNNNNSSDRSSTKDRFTLPAAGIESEML